METAVATPEPTLLRSDQIEEMEGEREGLKAKLNNPRIEDKGEVAQQLRRLDHQLESQRPRPFESSEIDAAVKEEAKLRSEWSEGMLSAEEMRKCPPGAVDRHLSWERKNVKKIERWQNIMRRLNSGSDAREIASIERFRPQVSQMNMAGALIPGKQFFLPPEGVGIPTVFSDADIAAIREKRPDLAAMIGLMNNDQRAAAKSMLIEQRILFSSKASEDGHRGVVKREAKKRTISAAHKAALMAGRKAALEAKKAA